MQNLVLKKEKQYLLSDIEAAGISYMPAGLINGRSQPLFPYKHLWGETDLISLDSFPKDEAWRWEQMDGIFIFTGVPTLKCVDDVNYFLIDIDIERRLVDLYPNALKSVGKLYRERITGNPLITKTKSGGFRLSAFGRYSGNKAQFIDKQTGDMLLEVFAKHGLSRYDARYEIVEGCLLDIPFIDKDVFPMTVFTEIKEILCPFATMQHRKNTKRAVVGKYAIRGLDADWTRKLTRHGHEVLQSQLFPTENCPITSHVSNRDEVRFTKYPNGSIDGICFNCGERWWEVLPLKVNVSASPVNRRINNRRINRRLSWT